MATKASTISPPVEALSRERKIATPCTPVAPAAPESESRLWKLTSDVASVQHRWIEHLLFLLFAVVAAVAIISLLCPTFATAERRLFNSRGEDPSPMKLRNTYTIIYSHFCSPFMLHSHSICSNFGPSHHIWIRCGSMDCSKSVTRRRSWNCPRVFVAPPVRSRVPFRAHQLNIVMAASPKKDSDHLSINVTPAISSGALFPLYSLPVRYNPTGLLFSYGLRGIERPSP